MENVVDTSLRIVTIRVALITVANRMISIVAYTLGREANGKC